MALKTRNPQLQAVAQQAARMAYRIVLTSLDGDDNVQASASGDRVLQKEGLDRVFPWGVWSHAPADGEAIAIPTECGDVVVADRVARPSALSGAGEGEAALFDVGGNLVWMRSGSGIELRPKTGQKAKVTDGAGAEKAVGLNGDTVSAAAAMATWIAAVQAILTCAPIVALYNVPPYNLPPPVAPADFGLLVASALLLEAK